MIGSIEHASEHYRVSVKTCRDVFAAAGREFVEPAGIADLIRKARELYAVGDEAAAVKEVENARQWLNGIATKYLRGGIDHFEGKIVELSYMSLDQDIMEKMRARLRDFCAALMLEQGETFELRVEAYRELASAVNGARAEQFERNERRERLALEEAENLERERRRQRRQQEEQDAADAKRRQEEAEAAARAKREKQFDELFQ